MNILLTGSTGFVGSQVARQLLQKGHAVRAHFLQGDDLSRISDLRDNLQLIEGDLFDSTKKELSALCAEIDACIHCAWYAKPGKYLSAPQNMDCLWNSVRLFEALGKAGCRRIVGVGTCFEYDCSYGYLSETTPTKATNLYAAAKTSTFLMGEQLAAIHGMTFAWARLFYLFGPYEDPKRLLPFVTNCLLRGERANMTSGYQVRDFLHVEDVASALISVMEREFSGPVNIGSGSPVTVREIVSLLAEILDRLDLIDFGARPPNATDPPFICANNSKLRSDTDWEPRYNLEEALRATILWWKHRTDRKEQST